MQLPDPLGKEMKDNQQSQAFRKSDETASQVQTANGATVEVWFSPNRPERRKPTSKNKPTPMPPEAFTLVYRRMRMAKEGNPLSRLLPGQSRGCIIGEAIDIGTKDVRCLSTGAVSSPQAMPNYVARRKDEDGKVVEEGESPTTFDDGNISIVRAARIDDRTIPGAQLALGALESPGCR